ncbi:efflux RND transporter periplasmic adaptor subunit [Shewanella sp. Isolate11]|uniref:efflux RND transporter periplasmic adaptor subunit n=1 Tax=Shewanella sp. Isolate11 TaxID=2908530 RepID=UPI001EFCFB9A|nr:efflux RND transporter periplasmic adaptor subunit [Shewanella sp. Isolate11]MCG9697306.1 efflux RND transporter periplasmic adaptor subunit [Shewanella sp. Isolate11]
MNKKLLVTSILLATMSLVAFSQFSFAEKSQQQNQPNTAQQKPQVKLATPTGRVVPIVSGAVSEHQLTQHISLIGKLEAQRSVDIAAEVAGKITQINVDANELIQANQILVVLDDAKPKASVAEAKAYLSDEQRKLDEYQKLSGSHAITQTEIAAQKASVDMALARLQAAQAELDFHTIRAPFSGTAGLVDFSLGKMVSAGNELLSLDDLSSMRLDVQVPEMYLSRLYIGMEVTAISRAWEQETFSGKVVAIDPRINPDTLNLKVRVSFDNPNNKLMPGMLMTADIGFAPVTEPVVPVQALEYSGTKRFVYVIDNQNVARRTQVTLGARIGDEVLITSGVKVGDKIVVQGLVNMRDGIRVDDLLETNEQASTELANNAATSGGRG